MPFCLKSSVCQWQRQNDYDALARLVDAGVVAKDMIDFVDERRQGSSMVGVDPFQTFLGIERRCDRYYRDVACTTTDPAWGAWRP